MARRSLTFRVVRGFISTIAAMYLLVVIALWYWQASFIFQPRPVVETTPSDLGVKFEKVTLPIGRGHVAGWWVPSQDPHSATLLFSHGNANNVGGNAPAVVGFQKAGLNVFIYDYRGYGESTGGPPREKLAYEDAERAWTYLVSERRIAPETIVIYGHSLGGVVAIDLGEQASRSRSAHHREHVDLHRGPCRRDGCWPVTAGALDPDGALRRAAENKGSSCPHAHLARGDRYPALAYGAAPVRRGKRA